jgi:predicted nucleic acid-binding protein
MARLIVLDAAVIIAHLNPDDAHHAQARQLLRDVAGEPLCTNPLNMAEALVVPAREGRLGQTLLALHKLGLQTIPFPQESPTLLALLRVETGLRMPDCCVLLAADVTRGSIATFDHRLAAAATARGHTVLGVQ